jgi:hypothetical protein
MRSLSQSLSQQLQLSQQRKANQTKRVDNIDDLDDVMSEVGDGGGKAAPPLKLNLAHANAVRHVTSVEDGDNDWDELTDDSVDRARRRSSSGGGMDGDGAESGSKTTGSVRSNKAVEVLPQQPQQSQQPHQHVRSANAVTRTSSTEISQSALSKKLSTLSVKSGGGASIPTSQSTVDTDAFDALSDDEKDTHLTLTLFPQRRHAILPPGANNDDEMDADDDLDGLELPDKLRIPVRLKRTTSTIDPGEWDFDDHHAAPVGSVDNGTSSNNTRNRSRSTGGANDDGGKSISSNVTALVVPRKQVVQEEWSDVQIPPDFQNLLHAKQQHWRVALRTMQSRDSLKAMSGGSVGAGADDDEQLLRHDDDDDHNNWSNLEIPDKLVPAKLIRSPATPPRSRMALATTTPKQQLRSPVVIEDDLSGGDESPREEDDWNDVHIPDQEKFQKVVLIRTNSQTNLIIGSPTSSNNNNNLS